MKKVLLALCGFFLFAASLSAQITIDKYNALPTSGSIFGKDEARTIRFDSVYRIFERNFDSSTNLGFTSANFDGHDGAFVWDSNGSVHSNQFYSTYDSSGFLIMDSEAMGDDTQRVTLTGTSFSTLGFNTLKVAINHHYKYSVNDSAANLMASTNGVTWNLVKSFSADMVNRGTSLNFANDTVALGAQYLNKTAVYLRFVYATDSGYQWAINKVTAFGDQYTPGYNFFKPAVNGVWDLSNIQYDGGVKYYSRKPAPNPYRYIDSLYNDDLGGLKHTTYDLNYFTTDGISAHAHLTYEQIIPLLPRLGTNDTLTIPVQFHLPYVQTPVPFASKHTKIKYPLTYQTKWGSDFAFSSSFFLTGQSFQGFFSPAFISGGRFTHIVEKDTVVGWGKMRVSTTDGNVQKYIDVLQLKTVVTQSDSFYFVPSTNVASNPARKVAFDQFMALTGLDTPVNVRTYTTIRYVRIGEIHPLVTVFMDGTDTFINKIEVHADHPWPLYLSETTTGPNDVSIYPNPVTGHEVNINVAQPENGEWKCDIINAVGQQVSSHQLSIDRNNGRAALKIPSSVAPGMYFLNITRDGTTVTIKPIEVLN